MKVENEFLDNIETLITENYSLLNQLRLVYDLHELTIGKAAENTNSKIDTTKDDVLVRLSLHTLFTISTLDLLSVLSLHKKITLKWEGIMLLKSAYLTIYESIKTFEKRKINLRNIITAKSLDIDKFDKIGNELRVFKKAFNLNQIEKIMNKTAGHIDEDFKDYFDILIEMDIANGLNAILKFLNVLKLLNNYLEDIRAELNIQLKSELQDLQEKAINQMEQLKVLMANLEKITSANRRFGNMARGDEK